MTGTIRMSGTVPNIPAFNAHKIRDINTKEAMAKKWNKMTVQDI